MNRLPEIPEGVTVLLTVEAEGTCAKIRLLLKEAGEWREILSAEGFVGKNGVTDCKRPLGQRRIRAVSSPIGSSRRTTTGRTIRSRLSTINS